MCEERKQRRLIAVLLVMLLLFPAGAARSSSATVVTLWIDNPVMQVGSTRQPIDAEGTRPVIVESRTLVPIRALIEAFGGVIEWDSRTQRVMIVLRGNTLDLWVGKPTASLNGKSLPIDPANPRVMPVILAGRTMLPLRFVSESLGMTVAWDQATRRIQLTYMAEQPPAVPSAPVLLSPAHATHVVNAMPWLSWQTDDGVNYSSLRILSATGTEVLAKSNLSGSDYR
ncbi:MAG TPA: copper amine oxidase N-terminal domain-containing protein, partial [Candidatus Cryosericum sp.]|nr:copper amine oxidase N-terminal domain-containing protein [Candidatus Cryosericum sp.]